MSKHKHIAATTGSLLSVLAITACRASSSETPASGDANQGLPQGSQRVKLDPADFSTKIDNRYWPMSPGSEWVYSETDTNGTKQKVVVTVADKTKTITNGVEARVIRDVVSEKGVPVEITDDWYAQDKDGNIWYLGEAVRNYDKGKLVDRAGSFEAGVDGAQAGIAMPADPVPAFPTARSTTRARRRTRAITAGEERVQVPSVTSTRTC